MNDPIHPEGGAYRHRPTMDEIGDRVETIRWASNPMARAMTPKPEPVHIPTREEAERRDARRRTVPLWLWVAVILTGFALAMVLPDPPRVETDLIGRVK